MFTNRGLEDRARFVEIETRRARAQALLFLMTSGVGNLFGYIGTGWWMRVCMGPNGTRWPQFWQGLAVSVAVVMGFFLISYRGREGGRAVVDAAA